MARLLSLDFVARPDPVAVARDLLGIYLISQVGGQLTVGRITETEAYWAPDDRASHAYGYRRTARTETMYAAPGTAYVYLCYGIHQLFNVVTGPEEMPHAVLIRAVEPVSGLATMQQRRGMAHNKPSLTAGPGMLSVAMGIGAEHNGISLLDNNSPLYLEDRNDTPPADQIVAGPRVGVGSSGVWAARPWRFYERDNAFVSKWRL